MSSTTSSSTRKRAERLRSSPPGPPTHGQYSHPVGHDMSATALRTHRCGELTRALIGQEVRLGGWVHRRRDLGGLVFIDLRDRAGLVQLSCNPDWTPAEVMTRAAEAGTESVVLVIGTVEMRPEPSRDPALKSREVEVHVTGLEIVGTGADARHSRCAEGKRGAAGRGAPAQAPGARSPPARAAAQPDAAPPTAAALAAPRSAPSSSSRSRPRSSPSRPPRARGTISCRAACTRASSTRCRRARRSTSSC